jgi:restriction system protein
MSCLLTISRTLQSMSQNARPSKQISAKNTTDRAKGTRSSFAVLSWWVWLLVGSLLYFVLQGGHALIDARVSADSSWPLLIDLASIAALVVCVVAGALSLMNPGDTVSSDQSEARGSPGEPRMSWGQFELLAMEAFRRRGFQITERGSSADDGSRNLQLTRGRQRFIAHCKSWRSATVDIGAVRELYSMVIVSKADGGFVITTGNFTQEARTFAAGRQLQLIDGQTLRELLRDAEGQPTVMPTIIPTGIVDVPTLPQR